MYQTQPGLITNKNSEMEPHAYASHHLQEADRQNTLVEQTVQCVRVARVPRVGGCAGGRAGAAAQRLPTELKWQKDRDTPFVSRAGSGGESSIKENISAARSVSAVAIATKYEISKLI